jgi:hypothetical protein
MNVIESRIPASGSSFPLLLVVSAAIPVCCLVFIVLLAALRSDFVILAAFFGFVLSAASGILGLLGVFLCERPRRLFLICLAAGGAVLYAITSIDLH